MRYMKFNDIEERIQCKCGGYIFYNKNDIKNKLYFKRTDLLYIEKYILCPNCHEMHILERYAVTKYELLDIITNKFRNCVIDDNFRNLILKYYKDKFSSNN